MTFPAPSRLRLDGGPLIANWKTMARLSGTAGTGAAVKADAYGLGAREVVPRLWEAGCRDFFVAHWSEAEAIADLIPAGSIAVLNGICEADVAAARALGAIPVLNTPKQVSLWKTTGGGKCHVMIDSGINRLGLGPEQVSTEFLDGLEIDILMSHLASADEDTPQNAQQLNCFKEVSARISACRRSMSNSAGIALGAEYGFDLTRPGLTLYGGVPRQELCSSIRPVVRIEAAILQIREIEAKQPIGYNATYATEKSIKLATVSVGYADGYFRGFSNKGSAILQSNICPVVGRVSMDLTIIDISSVVDAREGDWIELSFDLSIASQISGMSQYELLTSLGSRYDRIWS